jgi:solute carrier family 10 (sodium/bile acid cotransporter), member 7
MPGMKSLLRTIARQWFIVGVALAIGVGYAVPEAGRLLDRISVPKIAIVVIFFVSGLAIRLKHLSEGLLQWRCHLLIQGISFLAAPALVWATSGWMAEGPVRLGAFLVAVLPTTIFSCVAFTAAAGGNAACAIISAVGGNLLGVALSPLLLGLLSRHGAGLDVGAVSRTIRDLCLLVLLPLLIGQAVAYRPSTLVAHITRVQSYIGMSCVLLIIFCAFSKSIGDIASQLSAMWRCFLYVAALHIALLAAAWGLGRTARLAPGERIAALFCGSQKTLSLGVPLAYSYYRGTAVPVGIVILPLVFFHLFQLTLGSVIVARMARSAERAEEGIA